MPKPIKSFKKVLIANRGEIAVRVSQTLQEMGIKVIALYSDADKNALHVRMADEAYHLPGNTAAETYLQAEKILSIAKKAKADAIHPGYGFLSENAGFATACAKAGITFIGPSPEAIESMGDKIIAKSIMTKAGVPVVPGWAGDINADDIDASFNTLSQEAESIGYPLLVKAAAGGGGKGMRLVNEAKDLKGALEAAAREAKNAFGDNRIFLEKYITRPRHVEFQIFGDEHGNVVHLFERECSIQRRHQKIIEESPSPALDSKLRPKLREKMGQAAINAAKAINYTNAGTVEFILAEDGSFYFLEVNTRLQVEHPVTEMVTHLDLVQAQIAVAQGEELPFSQGDLRQEGHAIECRIYAEDASRNFMPSIGRLAHYHPPDGPDIRVDSGVESGSEVSIHYDPMLSKLIVWGENREKAINKAKWALNHFPILGVTTNTCFLRDVISHPAFESGNIHTHFLDEHEITSQAPEEIPDEALIVGALVLSNGNLSKKSSATGAKIGYDAENPWQKANAWRAY